MEDSALSPVTRAEMAHLRRIDPNRAGRILGILLLLALIASGALTGGLVMLARSWTTTVNLRETYGFFAQILLILNVLLLALAIVDYLMTFWRTLLFASSAVAREKIAGTWDTLILTHTNAWQIIFGKWWGGVSHMALAHQRGLLLRGAALLWLGLTAGINELIPSRADLPLALVIAPLVMLITIMNVMLAAALGLIASLLVPNRMSLAAALALLLLLGLIVAALDLLALTPLLDRLTPLVYTPQVSILTFMLLDGGTLLGFSILGYALPATLNVPLIHVALSLLIYPPLTAAALWSAYRLAIRDGALPVK